MSRVGATSSIGHHRDGVTVAALALLTLLLGSCAALDGILDGGDADGAATATGEDGAQDAADDDGDAAAAGAGDGPGGAAADLEPEVEVEEEPAPFHVPGAGELTLTTPAAGQGQRPVLSWEPVPEAETYHVSVYDPEGVVYWAWSTDDVEVVLGGFEAPPGDGARGPRLAEPMTWHVLARAGDGRIVAQSGVRPIAP